MEKKKDWPKLPKGFKTKWVKALRSGEYKQGKNALIIKIGDTKKYCCLGVACVVASHKPKIQTWYIGRGMKRVPKILIGDNPLTNNLSRMNDIGNKTFRGIATWIEKYL